MANDKASFYIQWKGTHVCGDFHCICGSHEHTCDTGFMYYIRCTKCERQYRVPDTLELVEETPGPHVSAIVNLPKTQHELDHERALEILGDVAASQGKSIHQLLQDCKPDADGKISLSIHFDPSKE